MKTYRLSCKLALFAFVCFMMEVSGACMPKDNTNRPLGKENQTVNKILNYLDPVLDNNALTVKVVRTSYAKQSLHVGPKGKGEVVKTTINSLTISAKGVKENVFTSVDMGFVKNGATDYSNDGKFIYVFDRRNNKVLVEKSNADPTNKMIGILSPIVSANMIQSFGSPDKSFLERLRTAKVASEKTMQSLEGMAILVEGSYTGADPQDKFELCAIPGYNYAIVSLSEFDRRGRVLYEMTGSNFFRLSTGGTQLYLPKHSESKEYIYDDVVGEYVQFNERAILNPRIVPLDIDTFKLDLPDNASIYNSSLGIDIKKGDATQSIFKEIVNNPAFPILTKANGKDILGEAESSYNKDQYLIKKAASPKFPAKENAIALPRNRLLQRIFSIGGAGMVLLACAGLYTLRALKRRKGGGSEIS